MCREHADKFLPGGHVRRSSGLRAIPQETPRIDRMPQKLPGDFSKASWKDLRGYCTFCVRHFAFETMGVVHLSGSIYPSRLLLGPWAWPFGSVGFPRFQFGPRAWSLCLEGFIFHVVRFPFWTTGVVLCVNLNRLFLQVAKAQ